ncbi:MAG TPA: DNA sulfur modification protein DndD, partial [Allocoleopsis sp.]
GLLETTLIQTEKELNIEQQKMAIDVIMRRDNKFLDYIRSLELSQDYVSKIKDYLQSENDKLELEVNNFVSWLNTDVETKMQLEKLVKYEIKANIDQGDSYIGILEKVEREMESLERQIAAAPSPEMYEKLEKAVKIANDQLAKIKAEYELKKERVARLQKEITKTKKELHEYAEESINLKDNEHLVTSVSRVKDTLKLFKEKLTLKKLNKLETEVTECFKYLLHKSDLVNKVVIGQENFSISLYDFQGKLVPKHRLSAGEKQLLAVAFLWGLARVSGRNLPVAIDTPLGRLDSSHRSNLVERYFPAASHQVILLSTDTEITEIEVKKLREQKAIAAEYLLKYDINQRHTVVENGYFW